MFTREAEPSRREEEGGDLVIRGKSLKIKQRCSGQLITSTKNRTEDNLLDDIKV